MIDLNANHIRAINDEVGDDGELFHILIRHDELDYRVLHVELYRFDSPFHGVEFDVDQNGTVTSKREFNKDRS